VSGNEELFARAQRVMPGGVNSPVRAFKAVGGAPRFVARAEGAFVWDADGRRYLDYVGSWGPMLFGHAFPPVLEAVTRAARQGTSFGAPTEAEVELAERVCRCLPSIEKVRFVSSGTEAVMSALRLARGFTGRRKVVKLDGCYHGHSDALLVAAGSGVATLGLPGSAGVPEGTTADTIVAPYNDAAALEALGDHGSDLAALIVEPVAGNMGCVPPKPGYLQALREITARSGALLVFDEVITGFRLARGGAQEVYGVRPDLTCLGKVIGGGLPVAAYGGRAQIMDAVAPLGPVYQAGTLSGNPLAMAAGIAMLDALAPAVYERLEALGQRLETGLRTAVEAAGQRATVNRVGSMLTLFFCDAPVTDYATAKRADTVRFARFFHAMLERGIALPPAQFEAWFVSAAHSEADIDRTVEAAAESLRHVD
jgi:glutamate-1-semialdehyde 2,1-aminomutase